jgi:hypothetical protein
MNENDKPMAVTNMDAGYSCGRRIDISIQGAGREAVA